MIFMICKKPSKLKQKKKGLQYAMFSKEFLNYEKTMFSQYLFVVVVRCTGMLASLRTVQVGPFSL